MTMTMRARHGPELKERTAILTLRHFGSIILPLCSLFCHHLLVFIELLLGLRLDHLVNGLGLVQLLPHGP